MSLAPSTGRSSSGRKVPPTVVTQVFQECQVPLGSLRTRAKTRIRVSTSTMSRTLSRPVLA
jgi:hypothetical protein